MAELTPDKKILIVGLGLMGGSYADALSAAGYETGAVETRRSALDYALSKGIIAHGRTEPDAEYVGSFDIIVFALYPHVFADWISSYGQMISPGTLVTDVTGVKACIVPSVKAMLPAGVEFVPAHPMAGRESFGVENSDRRIFRNANFIITPTEDNSVRGVDTVRELAEVLGCPKISVITPEEHDEMIAFLSQLTHCIAVVLMACKDSERLADCTGDSFRDLTRIARINEDMWTELFLDNRRVLLAQMDLFLDKFRELRDALEASDTDTIKSMMRLSTYRRSFFDKNREEDT